jgi:hypothetical protein
MLSPAVLAARGHECHQVLIQPHRQLGRAEHGAAHGATSVPSAHAHLLTAAHDGTSHCHFRLEASSAGVGQECR